MTSPALKRLRLDGKNDDIVHPDPDGRPRTRGDCAAGPRPCGWVTCRMNLYLDVSAVGTIKINQPMLDIDELADTCALDVADRGGVTLEEIGTILNLSRERIRQVESYSLSVAKKSGAFHEFKEV